MCGRYLLMSSGDGLASWFGYDGGPALSARYNIAPSQPIAVVRTNADAKRECALARWGLIPSWAKDTSIAAHTINARAETLAEKPAFRTAFRRRRCLVPADGFYEWLKSGKKKLPHAILPKDHQPLAFAGLWDHWQGPGGQEIESATIVTTQANELLRPLHERMPVILPREQYVVWLDPRRQEDELLSLLAPYPDELLRLFPVSAWVSNARHEGERCLTPEAGLFA
jgi:putative SOS response-associated peptidase YedK